MKEITELRIENRALKRWLCETLGIGWRDKL